LNKRAELFEIDSADLKVFSYSIDENADFCAKNICIKEGLYSFDFIGPGIEIPGLRMKFPGRINIENAVAAIGVSLQLGVTEKTIRKAVESFKGIQRRFDIRFRSDKLVYIDDYAHHPVEIKSTITSVKELYQDQELTGIFQPHLYSRTSDLYEDFAESLEGLDKLILLDIYPAREEPVPGVTSELILNMVSLKDKEILSIDEVIDYVKNMDSGVLLTLGAGDIDKLAEPIESIFKEKNNLSVVES
jgi:UDP-N-acetylmuramate--alanine ligase